MKAGCSKPSSAKCGPDAALVPALVKQRMAGGPHCRVEVEGDVS